MLGSPDEVPEALELLVLIVAFAEDAVFTGALLSGLNQSLDIEFALGTLLQYRKKEKIRQCS